MAAGLDPPRPSPAPLAPPHHHRPRLQPLYVETLEPHQTRRLLLGPRRPGLARLGASAPRTALLYRPCADRPPRVAAGASVRWPEWLLRGGGILCGLWLRRHAYLHGTKYVECDSLPLAVSQITVAGIKVIIRHFKTVILPCNTNKSCDDCGPQDIRRLWCQDCLPLHVAHVTRGG